MIYGLAFSLIAAASRALRRRDTIILILAATIAWGMFVETDQVPGMVRFIVFASLITMGVSAARAATRASRAWVRVLVGAGLPGALCALGGMIYQASYGCVVPGGTSVATGVGTGVAWGLVLGLAVGLGIAAGDEAVRMLAGQPDTDRKPKA